MVRLKAARFAPRRLSFLDKLSSLFVLLILALIFVGCQSIFPLLTQTPHQPTQTQTAPASPATASPTPIQSPTATLQPTSAISIRSEELRGVMIRFWHPWTGLPGQTVARLAEEFNLTNPWGVLVTAVSYPGYDALQSSLEAAFQTSDAPQVTLAYLYQALAWDSRNNLIDLQPYVNDPQWGISPTEQADFYPLYWNEDLVDGRRLGLPASRSGQLLLYNQSWAKELGYEQPPADPDQFLGQACAAAAANQQDSIPDNNSTGGWIISTDYAVMLSWIYAFGGEALKSPEPGLGQNVYQFNTPQNEQAFTFLRAAYQNRCAWLPEDADPETEFAHRRGLFSTASIVELAAQEVAFRAANNPDQWTVLPFPSFDGRPAFDAYGPSYVLLPASTQQQLAAWLFVRWLTEPQQHARLVEASGSLPVRKAALERLKTYSGDHPQWATAVDLLPAARVEPPFQSWGKARWALADAATQLYRPYFTLDQTPALLKYLDAFVAELHLGPDLESAFATVTNTLRPTAAPSRTPLPSATLTSTQTPRPPVVSPGATIPTPLAP